MSRGAAVRLLAVALIAIAVWIIFLKCSFVGVWNDPVAYLNPARNFARGLGLKTDILWPAQVAGYPQGLRLPAPYLHHGPLAPWLLGWGYKLFGVKDCVPLALTFGCTLLSGLLVYWLGRDVGGEKTGLSAAALFWLNYSIMDANVYAPTDAPFILFLTGCFVCLWESGKPGRSTRWTAAAAVLLALASSTRLAGQTYWLGLAAAAWWLRGRDRRAGAVFIATTAACMIPLWLYNHAAAGVYFYSPGFYMLNWSPSFPGFQAISMYHNPSSLQAVLSYPKDFLQKLVTGPMYGINRFIAEAGSNPYTMACAALGLLTHFKTEPRVERVKRFAWIVSLFPVAFVEVISYGPVHYLGPIMPFLLILAAAFLWKFFEENRAWAGGLVWLGAPLAALMLFSGLALKLKDNRKELPALRRQYEDYRAIGLWAKERTRPGEVIYTDSLRMTSWYAERPSISLTTTMEDARKTFAHVPPDVLLLTSYRIDSSDYAQEWRDAYNARKPIMGFEPCEEFKGKTLSAALYRKAGRCRLPG